MKIGYSFGSLVTYVDKVNSEAVKLTGNQSIAGAKTFTSNPISSAIQNTAANALVRYDTLTESASTKYDKDGGAISGEHYTLVGNRRVGLCKTLGLTTDMKVSLVLLAKKPTGLAAIKSGFSGKVYFDGGSATEFQVDDHIELVVSAAYTTHKARIVMKNTTGTATYKLVEVTYGGEVYFALHRTSAGQARALVDGISFDSTLPILVPDASLYTVTDVSAPEFIYTTANKPPIPTIAEITDLQNQLNYAKGLNEGLITANPNDSVYNVIVTRHANCPDGGAAYWHITTTFLGSIAASSSRRQDAVEVDPVGNNCKKYVRSFTSGKGWSLWNMVYTDKNPQPLSANGAAAANHSHTAAAGNADIVSSGHSQVGTYAMLGRFNGGGSLSPGDIIDGGEMSYSNCDSSMAGGTAPPGRWKCLGYVRGDTGSGARNVTIFVRVS